MGKIIVGAIAGVAVVVVVVVVILALGNTGLSSGGGTPDPVRSSASTFTPPSPSQAFQTMPAQVARADPQSIAIPSVGVDAPIELYTVGMAQAAANPLTGAACYSEGRIACVNPPEYDRAYWLKAGEGEIPFGDQAGSDSTGTVYLVGHASETTSALFNDVYKLAVGDTVDLTTANGVVSYEVQEVVVLDKSDWSSSAYANEQVPGRLVLGTCYHASDAVIGDSGSSTQNVLVVAQTESTASVIGG
ncbi:MAG: class F sortase [Propionibacteriaceae bacterium]|nr:class F sortase [Propionibacteriaceae bacterium]